MLRNSLLIVFLLLALALGVASWFGRGGGARETGDLPWQVVILPDGASRIFGVTLGRTTARELNARLRNIPRVALFVAPDGRMSLEAYYGTISLGMFEARLDVTLGASRVALIAMAARAVGRQPTATGAWRLALTETDTLRAYGLPITGITYVPRVRYDEDLVLKSFGSPVERVAVSDGQVYWLYPQRGLALLRGRDGHAVLYYVAPSAFAGVRTRIDGMGMVQGN
ncbi:hypothetical protein BI364_11845 [Acidihalobacter yilgarnensis]|uniref:Uncharacterized protein n=1 Tax=Acidihalobacter yilgarnensis TaxID=2819280 RepID=A0A1D8IQ88_9GAMM|nr:hypothetical protein [Acidihalobacter yilgarnensis]AOU98554.1 hypothetical protein BI364_11845 [Acidihalobacter yilgarnensis]